MKGADYQDASRALPIKLSPIETLPPELLAEIFHHNVTYDSFSPVYLSHVSAFWRRTAITTPRLWRRISAHIPPPAVDIDITSAKVHAWLDRAGSFPVHVLLFLTEWSPDPCVISLLESLRKHRWHWGRFTLTTTSYSIAHHTFVFFAIGKHVEMLSRVDLEVSPLPVDIILDEDPPEPPNELEDMPGDLTAVSCALHDVVVCASRLTELNIASAAFSYASWGATACPDLPHLRTLRIFDRESPFGQIDAVSILRILGKCPALESFSFQGLYILDSRSDVAGMIQLPHLRVLHLAQTFHQRIILSHLYTPRLEVLRLLWLNRPDILIEAGYDSEPLEEFEEPTEYSQSPHTDVLTGIGLRTLVRRSSPPLKILDMDFADARSPRDFVWLFTQLPSLETFRIVGSDMSDKVLNSLAHPTGGGTWLCPRLTHVELSRCDIITGQGVIALARGRNPPNDCENVERGQVCPTRLVELQVEACASVDCESVAVKQYIMGDVNFEVEQTSSWPVYLEEGLQMPD